MLPLVSVITPCYNGEKYLDSFFSSLLKQDYRNFEIIFVNDGSTDKTEEIALKYKNIFENKSIPFKYIKQKNGGQANAMNRGFQFINGKYFMWPDADDELYSDNIYEKVQYMEKNPSVSLVISEADYVREDGSFIETMKRTPKKHDNLFRDLLISKNVVFCPGIFMIRTDSFFECFPNKKIIESRIGQNYQILIPMAYKFKYGYIEKSLYKYILHEKSHSNLNRNDKQTQLNRFLSHEQTIYSILESICKGSELEQYKNIVQKHYLKLYLRISYQFNDYYSSKKYYDKLKSLKSVDFKDFIYHKITFLKTRNRRPI